MCTYTPLTFSPLNISSLKSLPLNMDIHEVWEKIFLFQPRSLIVTHNLKWLSELNLFTVSLIVLASVLLSLEISRSGLVFLWEMKLHETVIWFRPCENITFFLEPIRFWIPRHCISNKYQYPFTLQQQLITEELYSLFYIFNYYYWNIYKYTWFLI
jgi:hypothetical protein